RETAVGRGAGGREDSVTVGALAKRSMERTGPSRCVLVGTHGAGGNGAADHRNKRDSIQSLRAASDVVITVARTVPRDTFTCRPARKSGFRWILRSVSTARPSAHRQKRRIPGSR